MAPSANELNALVQGTALEIETLKQIKDGSVTLFDGLITEAHKRIATLSRQEAAAKVVSTVDGNLQHIRAVRSYRGRQKPPPYSRREAANKSCQPFAGTSTHANETCMQAPPVTKLPKQKQKPRANSTSRRLNSCNEQPQHSRRQGLWCSSLKLLSQLLSQMEATSFSLVSILR